MSITHESAFEANIEAHLLGDGWDKLESRHTTCRWGCSVLR